MAEEKTTSKRPSKAQMVAQIRAQRCDLDAMEQELAGIETYLAESVTPSVITAGEKIAEARMWLARAVSQLGEPTTDDDDKADEQRPLVNAGRSATGASAKS